MVLEDKVIMDGEPDDVSGFLTLRLRLNRNIQYSAVLASNTASLR